MDYMAEAIILAKEALGYVSPNPAVGAVVVKEGHIIGRGHTQPVGGKHAEMVALEEAGKSASGAELYVTLEPHAHHSLTPPCTDLIIKSGITSVYIATKDPNPLVNGRGIKALQNAGVKVSLGDRKQEADQIIEAFAKYITTGRPSVVAKFSMSLDGKIATSQGESKWITGASARASVHALRSDYDSIMVGIGTVLKDNPKLTVRGHPRHDGNQPLRVIVDSATRTPSTSNVFSERGETLIATASALSDDPADLINAGASIVKFPDQDGRVDLDALIAFLGQQGLTSILVEGGSTLLGSLFDIRAIDKVVCYIAPSIIGGVGALTAVGGKGITQLQDALQLQNITITPIGEDVMITGYPR